MYISDQLNEIYETQQENKVNFLCSEYFLLHASHIEDISLSTVARDIGIAKSSVSKFIKNEIGSETYYQFQFSLASEKQFQINQPEIIYKDSVAFARRFESVYGYIVDMKQLEEVANVLFQASKIIVMSSVDNRCAFPYLRSYMFSRGIRLRTFTKISAEEIESLTEKDAFLIVYPDLSYNDLKLRYIRIHHNNTLYRSKSHLYYIGKPSDHHKRLIDISVNLATDIYMQKEFVYYLGAKIISMDPRMADKK